MAGARRRRDRGRHRAEDGRGRSTAGAALQCALARPGLRTGVQRIERESPRLRAHGRRSTARDAAGAEGRRTLEARLRVGSRRRAARSRAAT
jgi:hypothetical protein